MFVPVKVCKALFLVLVCCTASADYGVATDDAEGAAWAALRGGHHVAIMRHAIAPGTGDPFSFTHGDCATQRNLDQRGRNQARAIGQRLRDNGVSVSRVYSSRWCRCIDTAELLAFGEVQPLELLDSLLMHRDHSLERTAALREWIAALGNTGDTVMLVTHNVNISALTGIMPASGEIVVLRTAHAGNVEVVGTIRPPDSD